MDSLDHMLTDPLELGPCGDGHGTRIMEDCLLGGTRVSLPEDLLEDGLEPLRVLVTQGIHHSLGSFTPVHSFCLAWIAPCLPSVPTTE
ncbi:hypothetical protein H8959_003136 [Pygathrix nigripes]